MSPAEVDRAMVNEAANRLRLIHWDGMGCGTHGPNACTNCFGPSPMTAYEVAAEVLAAVLPEIQAQALREAAEEIPGSNSTEQQFPIDPYDSCAEWMVERAARLSATTEEPAT